MWLKQYKYVFLQYTVKQPNRYNAVQVIWLINH
jgi:hypothetical protein